MNSTTDLPRIPETSEWLEAGLDGSAIRKARERLGMSRADFAAAVGVTGMSVGNWESGRHVPTKSVRLRVLEVLGLEVEPTTS